MFVPMHATFDVSSLRSWNIPLHFVRCTESALFRADVKVEDKTSENEHLIPSLKWKNTQRITYSLVPKENSVFKVLEAPSTSFSQKRDLIFKLSNKHRGALLPKG